MAEKKKVLVLDDEQLILELVEDIFRILDLEVQTAQDGWQAVDVFRAAREKGQPFDLVLLDMTLPGELDGAATLQEMRKLDPGIKAVVSSGYSADDIVANARRYGFDAAVPKPYSISVLRETVKQLLEG